MKTAAVMAFLLLDLFIYHSMATRAVLPERRTFDHFPLQLGDWVCERPERMEAEVEENLGVSDYHLCTWQQQTAASGDAAAVASLYVGYHATQVREEGGGSQENSIHPPAHCLPGSGWDIIRFDTVTLDLPGLPGTPVRVKRLQIAKGGSRQLVYYWYQSAGRVIAEDWQKILYLGFDRATRSRTDGALVRFTVPIFQNDETAAEATFRSLAPGIVAQLPAYVPN